MTAEEEWVLWYVRSRDGARAAQVYSASPFGRDRTTAAVIALTERAALVRVGHTVAVPRFAEKQQSENDPNRPDSPPESAQNALNRPDACSVFGVGDSNHEVVGGGVSDSANGHSKRISPEDTSEHWWVCCSWYADDSQLCCHGEDGYPPYIHCRDEEHASFIAYQHQRDVMHRARPNQPQATLVASDICFSKGKRGTKRFVTRVGGYDQPTGR